MTYRPETLAALGIDAETAATPGNVAAHAVNVWEGGGLGGINLGWADQPHSTRFVVSIVGDLDALLDNLDPDDMMDDDEFHEIVDSAIPYPTRDRVQAVLDFGILELEDPGLLPANPTLDGFAAAILYEVGMGIVYSLAESIGDARAEIADEIEEEGK